MTPERGVVLDPFLGVGTTAIAALMHGRRALGAEIESYYVEIAKERLRNAELGTLRIRPMRRAVYDPNDPKKSVPPQTVDLSSVTYHAEPFLEESPSYAKAASQQ
jgi:adenine-specific DNA-methyltransferase